MMYRIVRLQFQPEHCSSFLAAFDERRVRVVGFPGCHLLKLLHDAENPCVFYTFSCWENAEALEKYRGSEVFQSLWSLIKPWFSEKAKAWSMNPIYEGENIPGEIQELFFNR
ncbi:MAG: antibiotic biosynthesis monooxygenase [Flavobacteriia bacterium]|jgi:autoinducer 2-degrading protein|nr:antibiotic biosynthesis monooxygenase [Flavobacteriia bacterium]